MRILDIWYICISSRFFSNSLYCTYMYVQNFAKNTLVDNCELSKTHLENRTVNIFVLFILCQSHL